MTKQIDLANLKVYDHSRDAAGLTYVYPVLSRRSGGVSIGINLNPNNHCNWRCVYCQVPDLARGSAPAIDLHKLEEELRSFLGQSLTDSAAPTLRDVAISGNGEPTSCHQLPQVIQLVGSLLSELPKLEGVKRVLITNGSLVRQHRVQESFRLWNAIRGEVWFKLDRATAPGIVTLNGARISPQRLLNNLDTASRLCRTWVQTCMFTWDGEPPNDYERSSYLTALQTLLSKGASLAGVLLYGVARPSMQPEGGRIGTVEPAWLETLAEEIRALGLTVTVNP